MAWIESNDHEHKLLWLDGVAGVGKSAIAQTIAELCAAKGNLGASFFFNRGKIDSNDVTKLFPTLACQLASSLAAPKEAIDAAIGSDPSILTKGLDLQFQRLIIEPLSTVVTFAPMVLIIDGLDECQDNDGQLTVLHLFQRLLFTPSQMSCPLRILISSRRELLIQNAFERFHPSLFSCITVDELDVNDDIRTYLRHGFDMIMQTREELFPSNFQRPWPQEAAMDELVRRSSGLFIFAATVLRFVDDKHAHPIKNLEAILLGTNHSSAYAPIDRLYHQILRASSHPERLIPILGSILALPPTCHIAQQMIVIEGVLGLHPGDITLSLRALHSILNIPVGLDGEDSIRIVHPSFRDFLSDRNRSAGVSLVRHYAHTSVAVF